MTKAAEKGFGVQILLTNDDGIHAPGLHALFDELQRLGHVQLVAPAVEQSGVGLSITYLHPLQVREETRDGEHFGWAVKGSPADCVKMGVLEFCEQRPSLVVSGINSGANVGINVLYSGTVAGAIEGAFFGITSVAVSQSVDTQPDYRKTARSAVDVIAQVLDRNPPEGSLWNLNFPEQSAGEPKGLKVCRLGVKRFKEKLEKRIDPRGRPYYWSGLDYLVNREMEAGTDLREVAEGYVTLTPMHFDLTNHDSLEQYDAVEWEL